MMSWIKVCCFVALILGSPVGAQAQASVDIPLSEVGISDPPRVVEPRLFPVQINEENPPRSRWWKKESTFPKAVAPSSYSFDSVPESQVVDGAPVRTLTSFPGITYSYSNPPDPDLAVGPRHVVAVVNTRIAFFDKFTGQKQFDQPLAQGSFFNIPKAGDFYLSDPKIVFDRASSRFFVTILEVQYSTKQSHLHFAVSKSADPHGGWYSYRFNSGATLDGTPHWMDFPMLGFNKDGIVVSGNMFPFATPAAGWGSRVIAIRKSSVLNGGSAILTFFNEKAAFGLQPMRHNDSAVDRVYAVSARYLNALQIYCWRNLAGTPVMTKLSESPSKLEVLIVPLMNPPAAAKSKGNRFIDTIDGRLLGTYYRGGSLYAAHSVATGATNQNAQLRWYEIQTNNWPTNGSKLPTIRQKGVMTGPNGQAYYIPAIAANKDGDTALAFTRSSTAIIADLVTTKRKSTDPLNAMSAPTLVKASEGTFYGSGLSASSPARWGDYFGLVVDPIDDVSFWMAGQYGAANTVRPEWWNTRILRFLVRPTSKTPAALVSLARVFGGAATGNVVSARTSDNQVFQVQTGGTPTRATVNFNFRYTGDRTRINSLDFVLEASGAVGASADVSVFNRLTKKFEPVGSMPLTATEVLRTVNFRNYFAEYFSATGDIQFQVTAKGPAPFLFRTDLARLNVERA